MNEKDRKIEVEILGETYTLCSDDPPEHLQRVAAYVDTSLCDLVRQHPSLGPVKAAVLVSVMVADELLKERDTADRHADDLLSRINNIISVLDSDAPSTSEAPRAVSTGVLASASCHQ
jgi:cell division protein ZapA